jgi:hypothetical protein
MRYNLETMLPLGAFEHYGNRHIKLYGGGGSWNPIEIVENTVSSVGDVIGDVAQGIGDAGSDINEFVKEEIPGGWTLPIIVAVAVTTGYVDPTLFAAEAGAAGAAEAAAFAGATETGLATLAGEGAIADTIGATLLAGGEGAAAAGALEGAAAVGGLEGAGAVGGLEGAGAIPMELVPEMIPGGIPVDPGVSLGQAQLAGGLPMELVPEMIPGNIPVDPGISLGEAQLAAGVTPMELVPEMIPEGIPVDPGISLAEGQINAGAIPSDLKDAVSAANKARQAYNLLSGIGGTTVARNVSGLGQYTTPMTTSDQGGLSNFGIPNLTAGIVRGQPIDLNIDQFNSPLSPVNAAEGGYIQNYAEAGEVDSYKDTNYQDTVTGLAKLRPNLIRGKSDFGLQKYWNAPTQQYADGGSIEGHNPQFFSEGGLQNRYVKGEGDGTSDDVPAMLANGEFVIPADVVSSLGNGSNDSGAHILDEFLQVIRDHKRKADSRELPPDSKGALGYLLEAKRKAR